MRLFTTLLELAGFAAITTAAFLENWVLGIAAAGVVAIALGWLLGRST